MWAATRHTPPSAVTMLEAGKAKESFPEASVATDGQQELQASSTAAALVPR